MLCTPCRHAFLSIYRLDPGDVVFDLCAGAEQLTEEEFKVRCVPGERHYMSVTYASWVGGRVCCRYWCWAQWKPERQATVPSQQAKLYAALDVAFRQYSTTVFKGVPSSTTSSTASLCRA